jgi:hypothetical protein
VGEVSHGGFDCISLMTNDCWTSFHGLWRLCYVDYFLDLIRETQILSALDSGTILGRGQLMECKLVPQCLEVLAVSQYVPSNMSLGNTFRSLLQQVLLKVKKS